MRPMKCMYTDLRSEPDAIVLLFEFLATSIGVNLGIN